MAERSALEAAAAAGVITPEQVTPLHDFLVSRANGVARTAPAGEEDLRFIRNFHDVFLAIGILLFAVGLGVAIATYVSSAANTPQHGMLLAGACAAVAAAGMWGLGEFFARRRRLFLPAIAIVLAFSAFAVFAAAFLYIGATLGTDFSTAPSFGEMPLQAKLGILIAAAAGIAAPAVFYLRFRLPFSLGLTGMGVAAFVVIAAMIANFEAAVPILPALYLLLGLLLFAAGVAFDSRDPARSTRLSDNGFWLHFAAAPLILNGAFGLLSQAFAGGAGAMSSTHMVMLGSGAAAAPLAAATLFVVILLALLSLLINRRALIVSALLTTGVAIGVLMDAAGLGAGALAASTLIVLGAFVLILGAAWHAARRGLLGWIKPGGVWARIFPPEAPAATA